jgi:pimeloyl-ACP methyl ester carboxylesterase/predicted glycosyltransferase
MRQPDSEGFVTRGGVRIYYGVHGDGPVTILLIPPWPILHSHTWRSNIDYLSRHYRVIAFDPRGNGKSDRPQGKEHYCHEEFAKDALAILDETKTEKAAVISYSWGSKTNLKLCAGHPERVHCSVFSCPSVPFVQAAANKRAGFLEKLDPNATGWGTFNAEFWRKSWPNFVEWFIETACSDPHSWKGIEVSIDQGLETDGETMINTIIGDTLTLEETRRLCASVALSKVPTMVIGADEDRIRTLEEAKLLAEALGAPFVVAEGCGHPVHSRFPVWFNLLVKDFIDKATPFYANKVEPIRTWRRALARPKRILYLSSPIGLGHARRDAAIAAELRQLVPGLEVDWLTQSPVDKILAPRGEKLLPACKQLISEIAHQESESHDHCQPAFPIMRNMDTIMVNNFHVYLEAMEAKKYDLVIADEGWEVDFFLHEHPEHKRAPFVWTTDLVGMMPTAEPGEPFDPKAPRFKDRAYEEEICTDYNREYVHHLERFRHVRDLSLYIGDREDIPLGSLGRDLPDIRDHVYEFYEFSGYVLGFDPKLVVQNRDGIRAELGFRYDEKVAIVAVGGMSTGQNLLRKTIAAFPHAKREVPELRMIIVCGPRIAPESLHAGPLPDGLEIRGFVHDLWRAMAVSDLAVVHGGLTQTMDLTAAGVPFIVIPYLRQFEQTVWVRHRLTNYGAMNYVDYRMLREEDGPQRLATAMVAELKKGSVRRYKPVEDNAVRAAQMIRHLL